MSSNYWKFFNVERKTIKNLNTWTVPFWQIPKFSKVRWSLELWLVFILQISEIIKNWSVSLTTNISRESMYCDISGKSFILLSTCSCKHHCMCTVRSWAHDNLQVLPQWEVSVRTSMHVWLQNWAQPMCLESLIHLQGSHLCTFSHMR